MAVYNCFVDHLIAQLNERVITNANLFLAQRLIPSRLQELTDDNINSIYGQYINDLQESQESFHNEVRRWVVRLVVDDAPSTLAATLDQNRDAYPSIISIMVILLTIPATSATHERSLSSMKRIKTYLRNTMTTDRLTSLALLHIHRERDIDINTVADVFIAAKTGRWNSFRIKHETPYTYMLKHKVAAYRVALVSDLILEKYVSNPHQTLHYMFVTILSSSSSIAMEIALVI